MRKTSKKDVESLWKAILTLRNVNEAKRFFGDLLTKTEIQEFSERWKTARMLDSGISYSRIAKETGNSSTTIARVSRWLKSGKGGFRLVLQRTRKK
jgi:TrpR-related protein YerC/YecD